jgi:hypothetical protein
MMLKSEEQAMQLRFVGCGDAFGSGGVTVSRNLTPLTRFAAQIDLSPTGRGEVKPLTDRFKQKPSHFSRAANPQP